MIVNNTVTVLLDTAFVDNICSLGMVAHAFNPSTWETEAGGSPELEVSLVYIENFRAARVTLTA